MTARLRVIDANSIVLDYIPVPAYAITDGLPFTGTVELASFASADVGIWEMTEGGMRDVEAEELFVVIAGEAEVVIHHPDGTEQSIQLLPGSLVRFSQGMKTTWKVNRPLRKIYFLVPSDSASG